MSFALRTPTAAWCSGSTTTRKPSNATQLLRQLARFNPNQLSSYNGLKLLLPTKGRASLVPQGSAAARKPVQMSFLGVGAPEAILVAVVALVVFGPKGLAEAARSVGSALRSFQPTIKEVVQVSQELKGTLEKELGIDELRDAARPTPRLPVERETLEGPSGPVPDVMAKVMDPDIEAKRAASAQMAWGSAAAASNPEAPSAAAAEPAATASAAGSAVAAAASSPASKSAPLKDIASMSMEELEAELNRRRAATSGSGEKRQ